MRYVIAIDWNGKPYFFNGTAFEATHETARFRFFSSKDSAVRKAKVLLARHSFLQKHRLRIQPAIRRNPSGYARARDAMLRDMDIAADKFEAFTGFPADKKTTFKKRTVSTGFALGDLVAVTYSQNRGHGGIQHYEHEFKKNSRPLLVASSDGKQIDIVGGQYRVTDRGIEDT